MAELSVEVILDGQNSNEPENWKETELQLNFNRFIDEPQQSISNTKLSFVNKEADVINKWIADGKTFQGLPLKIKLTKDNNTITPFDGMLDLTDRENLYSSYRCDVKILECEDDLNIEQQLNSVTFFYLVNEGIITDADYVDVPYVVNSIPNYEQSAVLFLSLFVIGKELKANVKEISKLLADLAGVFTTLPAIIKSIAFVVYFILMVIAMIKLIQQLFDALIQPLKYHKGMYVRTLLEKACSYFDLKFESSILQQGDYKDLFLLPEKYQEGFVPNSVLSVVTGNTKVFGSGEDMPEIEGLVDSETGVPNMTPLQLIEGLLTMFNGKVRVQDRKLKLERKDFFRGTSSFKIPNIRRDQNGTNAHELSSNYLIQYDIDTTDRNTVDDYTGTAFQVITDFTNNVPKKYRRLQNATIKQIPFSRAITKKELTLPEKIFDVLFTITGGILNAVITVFNNTLIKAVNTGIKLFNGLKKVLRFFGIKINLSPQKVDPISKTNLKDLIDDRIGLLVLDKGLIGRKKIFILDGDRPSSNNETLLDSEELWKRFHSINSFVDKQNQMAVYSIRNVPFSLIDFIKVKNNPNCTSPEGQPAEIEDLKWNFWKSKADLTYRTQKTFAKNLKETYLKPTGS